MTMMSGAKWEEVGEIREKCSCNSKVATSAIYSSIL
jgi:hypothetical protein